MTPQRYDAIHPGELWLDTAGKPIHAHMPRLFYEDGVYYWYGLDKSRTTEDMKYWHWGVRYYRSIDLCNWEDCGSLIPPDLSSSDAVLSPQNRLDRPHILRCPSTGKYVCWFDGCSSQCATVLEADCFRGPYRVVHASMRPLDMPFGDFDLVQGEDGRGYCYFNRPHKELICAELTEDYTNVSGVYSTHFPRVSPPYVREAPAHFIRHGKHYLITSGTTSFYPNPSEVAVGDSWHGPFTILGNPHPSDISNTSFHSQISQVFKVPNADDLYIALADRWLPDEMDEPYAHTEMLFNAWFNPEYTPHNPDLEGGIEVSLVKNISRGRFVWLPLKFNGDTPYLDWCDAWTPLQQ
jgi:hypothetical protein